MFTALAAVSVMGVAPAQTTEQLPFHSEFHLAGFELASQLIVKLLHPLNASAPTYATDFGMFIDVRLLQPSNAQSPILVTESPMTTDVRPLQP